MHQAYRILFASLAWGIATHQFLHHGLGLGVPLSAGLLLVTAGIAGLGRDPADHPRLAIAAAALVGATLVFAFRESTLARLTAAGTAATALAWASARGSASALTHLVGARHLGGQLVGGAFAVASAAPRPAFHRVPRATRQVGRGALLAAPIAGLFLVLFAAADPVLAQGIRGLFDVDAGSWIDRGVGSLFWAWLGVGTVVAVGCPREAGGAALRHPPRVESLTIATVLVALFATAVAFQMRYLFGGDAYLFDVAGLTRAEYARRGFFELLVIALLAIPTIVWLRRPARGGGTEPALTGLLLALVGMLALLLVSAAHRLLRYHEAYGMSELRFYGGLVEVWLAGVLVVLGMLVARGRVEALMPRAAAWGMALVLAAAAANPAQIIQQANIARAVAGGGFDAPHAVHDLGLDGRPALVAGLAALPRTDRCAALAALVEAGAVPERRGLAWTWSAARARARQPTPAALMLMVTDCAGARGPASG